MQEKTKSGKLDWIALGGQEAIKDTGKPYYCNKKFVNNVQEAIKDTDKPCCCCKKYVNNLNKFNKSKQYICGLCKTVNYCSKVSKKKTLAKPQKSMSVYSSFRGAKTREN